MGDFFFILRTLVLWSRRFSRPLRFFPVLDSAPPRNDQEADPPPKGRRLRSNAFPANRFAQYLHGRDSGRNPPGRPSAAGMNSANGSYKYGRRAPRIDCKSAARPHVLQLGTARAPLTTPSTPPPASGSASCWVNPAKEYDHRQRHTPAEAPL